MTKITIADFVPGGILPSDDWHELICKNTCSRCHKPIREDEIPLMIWTGSGKNMLSYCEACTGRDASGWPASEPPATTRTELSLKNNEGIITVKKTTAALAAFLASSCAFAPAMAADVYDRGLLKDGPTGYDSPAAARSWTGLWVGALGGYQIANDKIKLNEADWCKGENFNFSSSENVSLDGLGQQGLFGEIQIGYDRQVSSNLVVGVFGGLNINNADFSIDASASHTIGSTTKTDSANLLTFEQKWGGVIGPRLGYLTSPSTMFYIAGGWAFGEMGRVKSDGKDVFVTSNGFSHDQETSLSGAFGEVGMETQLTGDLYLKVAGRYTSYSAIDLVSESTGNANKGESVRATLDHDVLAGMVGLTYKLGGR